MTRSFWSCSTTPIDGFAASGRFHGAHQVFHHALSLSENSECRLNPLIHWLHNHQFPASWRVYRYTRSPFQGLCFDKSSRPQRTKVTKWGSEKNGPTSRGNRLQKRIRKTLIAIETNMGNKWLKHVETNKEIYSFNQKWGLDHEKSVENGLKVHPDMGYDQVPMVTVYLRREVKH